MTTVTVKKAAAGYHVKLKSSDTGDFQLAIGTLKSYIHPSARTYDPQSRQWHIDNDAQTEFDRWITYLRTVLAAKIEWQHAEPKEEQAGGWREGEKRQRQWPPAGYRTQPTREELCARLHLLPDAPAEVVKAAYKALAQLNHPDKGGDTARMQELNEAFRLLAA
jgi:hypothetical protein